jgi:hypothetical protein
MPTPDITTFKSWTELLRFLGVNLAQIEEWAAAYKASHPDTSGAVDALTTQLRSALGSGTLTALAQAAAGDLTQLLITGSGPIGETEPTDFA